ncbi:MAG: inositol monophosphatase [Solirubrobacteraceae bacterium]|nr:inositol monophosphatase [Solirubrobacteraceae bacterium]
MSPRPVALRVIASEAARAAGDVLLARFAARDELVIRTKATPTDMVSEADEAAEAEIRRVLGARRPDDAILGEEGGRTGEGELEWVVDPLDGTTNFLYGIPAWCVSVAVRDAAGGIAGVVYDPLRDEVFAAERDGAATLNGTPLRRDDDPDLAVSLIGTGFGYDAAVRERQAAVAAAVLPRARDLRRVGAAALDLAWVAAGRLDGYYERGVKAWDVEAGILICQQAGLDVIALPAAGELPSGVLAAPARLAQELHTLVG